MKICLWSSASFEKPYASYHLMQEIINSMLKAGHEVWLVQMKYEDGNIPTDLAGNENLHVINIPMRKTEKTNFSKRYMQEIIYYFRSYKEIKEIEGIGCIFLQSTNAAFVPVCICNRKKIPLLYNVQDIFPKDAVLAGKISQNSIVYKMLRRFQKAAYLHADKVVTISEDLAQTISNETSKKCKADVIYNWSYQDEGYNIPDESNHFLTTYHISRDDGFRVVYAGNVGQMIDLDMLLNVAERLRNYNDIVIYIIGEGSNLEKLKKKTKQKDLKNIKFYPSQPMKYAPDNYCMADVNIIFVPKGVIFTCMPSKTNTCLLSQKPTVIAIDLSSDMAMKLKKVHEWSVVSPGDAESMSNAILNQYRRGHSTSDNAAEFMYELGPIENANKYVEILEQLAN